MPGVMKDIHTPLPCLYPPPPNIFRFSGMNSSTVASTSTVTLEKRTIVKSIMLDHIILLVFITASFFENFFLYLLDNVPNNLIRCIIQKRTHCAIETVVP